MEKREVVFVDGARSAFGKQGGSLKTLAASDIASAVIKGLIKNTGILERGGETAVDGVYLGMALGDKNTVAPARYVTLAAGLPEETESHFVEMQCGSAITAINHAASYIALGYADTLIVGGMESYSTLPFLASTCSAPYKGMAPEILSPLGSPFPDEAIDMIHVSEKMATIWNISRTECDEYAFRSQQRMTAAHSNGITGQEIIPITIPATKKTPEIIADKDEFVKPDTTMEGLSKLRAVVPGGVTTAGNASGKNDGAAFVLMMSAEKAKQLGYEPIARWVMGADIGVRPSLMGIGPAYSNMKALDLAGLKLSDMDVMECNEAFAAQNLSVVKQLEIMTGEKLDMEKWNPNGGAIAIGHPNGASGARIAYFAMKQLEKTGGKYGLFSSCCGGGHGTTTIIENLRR